MSEIAASGHGRGAAGSLDLLLGGGRERVGADLDGHGDVALAEDLHRLALADRAGLDQLGHYLMSLPYENYSTGVSGFKPSNKAAIVVKPYATR